ncbi:SIR2 family protein [Hoyosella sp. YIM 151337]|uniref:SIR2 family protein n=1 Tax=Hoyosella sp. YIM 151337 TaxID=2992742 RepID=UPI0022354465|nr:SIR2 family protein [Hoyosella sp. YIM 151337]MCW4354200.1 SIR2 family protein [Hoyosella sp. YIM 151337]
MICNDICVSAGDLNERTMDALRCLETENHLSVLLGAGASVGAGLPDWNTFAVNLLVLSRAIQDEETAKAFLIGQDPAIAAEAAKNAAGSDWPNVLSDALYGGTGASPAPLHTATASLVEYREASSLSFFTLNYDDLLETAVQQVLDELELEARVLSRAGDQSRAKMGHDFEVHHLHGLLRAGDKTAETLILTLSDYNKLGKDPHPWQVSSLQEALRRGALILAGTSYRDPDIRQWIHDLTENKPTGNVAVFLARESLALDRMQFSHVNEALINQWLALGVNVIPVQDHADAAQALRELPHLGNPNYLPPATRLGQLWQHHKEDFSQLQAEHSEKLAANLETLQGTLPSFRNLTLWLGDGEGGLVRWAANDRIYRDPAHLRSERPGFDSPWIAGQALGRNNLMVHTLENASATSRWRSVWAAPIVADLPGGPEMPCGVVSAASVEELNHDDVQDELQLFGELSMEWGAEFERLQGSPQ